MIRGRSGDCDLRHRLSVLKDLSGQSPEFDREQVSRIKRASAEWRRQLRIQETTKASGEFAGSILALAYPDRLAQGRGQIGQYRLANGRGAVLEAADRLAKEEYLAIGSLDGDKRNARIFLAAPITLAEIETEFADQIAEREIIAWNPRSEAVEAKRERHLGSLVLKEWPIDRPAPDQLAHAMIEGVRAMGIECLPWNKESRSLQSRVAFLRDLEGERKNWPDLSDEALIAGLEVWLLPWLAGKTRRQHLAELDLVGALVAQLDWPQRKRLDEWAPTHLVVPSGSRVALDYTAPGAPVMEVRLQEMFGASQTPRVADGRVNVTLRLLSPARRPVQTTTDLGGFWANSYHAVRADLRGRYPRHYWPDNPLVAEPTARAKPKGK